MLNIENLKDIQIYGRIVEILNQQCCTAMDGSFYFNYGMEDHVDVYGITLNTKKKHIVIADAAWSDVQLEKVYSIIGYATYHEYKVVHESQL